MKSPGESLDSGKDEKTEGGEVESRSGGRGGRRGGKKEGITNNRQGRGNASGMPWIKCLGGGGGKARRGKPLSVSQPIHLLVKVRFSTGKFSARLSREERAGIRWDSGRSPIERDFSGAQFHLCRLLFFVGECKFYREEEDMNVNFYKNEITFNIYISS